MSISSSPRGAMRSKLVSSASRFMLTARLLTLVVSVRRSVAATRTRRERARRRIGGGYPPNLLPAEQREDRKDAAVVVLRVRQRELLEDALHVPLDRARAEIELLRDRAVRATLGDQRE